MLHAKNGLRVAVTGAAGFIGRAVVARLERGALGSIAELRLNDVQAFEHPGAVIIPGSYAEARVQDQLLGGGIDVLFHLASLPGGAAERDPELGKTVNLHGSLCLLDAAGLHPASSGSPPTVVYASSIAALGRADRPVNDQTALRPAGSYGTHKAMVEFYLSDITRRGLVNGRSVRPAGVVARPRNAYEGFATAWMSDLFHAALEGRAIAIPARPDAQLWLQSVDKVADNIIHAALMPASGLPAHRAWTLPATVVRLGALADILRKRSGNDFRIDFSNGPTDQPALDAAAALAVGFTSDGDADALANAVLSRLENERGSAR